MIAASHSLEAGRPLSLQETLRDQTAARRRSIAAVSSHRASEGDAWNLAGMAATFRAIDEACRPSGGLACGDDLARLLEDRSGGDFVTLARMLSAGEVFGLRWRGSIWIPVFQFDLSDLSPRPVAQAVRIALGRSFNEWELARWFTSPNLWLQGRRPVDFLDSDSPSVLEAARADRFVTEG